MPRPRVVTIHAGPRELLSQIHGALESGGLESLEVDRPEEVPVALSRDGGNAVLVYSEPGWPTASKLLELLRKEWSDVPVIVLVNEANFDEFYELMSDGAYDYFETGEGAMVIADALRWAAHTHAVPPRMLGASRLQTDSAGAAVLGAA